MHYEHGFSLDIKIILDLNNLNLYHIQKILGFLDLGFYKKLDSSFQCSSSWDITMASLHAVRESIDWVREEL